MSEDEAPKKRQVDWIGFTVAVVVISALILALVIWDPLGNDGDSDPSPTETASGSQFPDSCSEWLTSQGGGERIAQADAFLDSELPGHSYGDTQGLTLLITQGCNSYGDSETPQSIAEVSVRSFKSGQP